MGTWNTKIDGNDAFLDVYQNFFESYNNGQDPKQISERILDGYVDSFGDTDDRNNSLFALGLAQWETKTLAPSILLEIKKIVESGDDLNVWRKLGADHKT